MELQRIVDIVDAAKTFADPWNHPQTAIQYPGKSINLTWRNPELIVVSEVPAGRNVAAQVVSKVTAFVFSSGNPLLDRQVFAGILQANLDTRVVLVRDANSPGRLQDSGREFSGRFVAVRDMEQAYDMARLILSISLLPEFTRDAFQQLFRKESQNLGWTELKALERQKSDFVHTAAQVADREEKVLSSNWRGYIFRSFLPVVRDLSNFRGVLVFGEILGMQLVLYKDSAIEVAETELHRFSVLLNVFSDNDLLI